MPSTKDESEVKEKSSSEFDLMYMVVGTCYCVNRRSLSIHCQVKSIAYNSKLLGYGVADNNILDNSGRRFTKWLKSLDSQRQG